MCKYWTLNCWKVLNVNSEYSAWFLPWSIKLVNVFLCRDSNNCKCLLLSKLRENIYYCVSLYQEKMHLIERMTGSYVFDTWAWYRSCLPSKPTANIARSFLQRKGKLSKYLNTMKSFDWVKFSNAGCRFKNSGFFICWKFFKIQ